MSIVMSTSPSTGRPRAKALPISFVVLCAIATLSVIAATLALVNNRAEAHRNSGATETVSTEARVAEARRLTETMASASRGALVGISAVAAREGNLTGVLASNTETGETFIAWSVLGGRAFAVGPIVDASGRNLTYDYEKELLTEALAQGGRVGTGALLESHPLVSRDEWEALASARYTEIGRGDRRALVFYDPDCAFCQKMVEDFAVYEDQMQLWLVPVTPANDPTAVAAMFFPDDLSGPAAVRAHNEMLTRIAGAIRTPVMVYEDSAGRLRYRVGAPQTDAQWQDLRQSMAPIQKASVSQPGG